MNYSFTIDHSLKIIKYKHSGNLNYEDIGKAWYQLLAIKEFTEEKYNLFSDYREASFKMKVDDINNIIEFMSGIKDVVNGKKQSILILDPYSTAGSILFGDQVYEEIGFEVKIFTTETAAIKWLTSS